MFALSSLIKKIIKPTKPEEKKEQIVQCKLFTPGPLCTSSTVKESMNFDYGSRDPTFLKVVADVRNSLLKISHVEKGEYEAILIQGSGTYAVEACIGCSIPKTQHKLLTIINGAYGQRCANIAKTLDINYVELKFRQDEVVSVEAVKKILDEQKDITHVTIQHSETTTGIINPIKEIVAAIKAYNKNIVTIVDAMSSYGVYDVNLKEYQIDYLASSPNKNLQGIPGFAFVLARTDLLTQSKYNARSYSLNMYDQWKFMETNGQFRFTPPTHVVKAFKVAIEEYYKEGGCQARFKRYQDNQILLSKLMTELGFKLFISPEHQGCIITTFLQPNHQNFKFDEFFNFLSSKNLVIYPGKLTEADTFRIGTIGEIYKNDIINLVTAVKEYLQKYQIPIPVPYQDNK